MKEATAINIQGTQKSLNSSWRWTYPFPGHIEQFKKELKREVVIATKEIGRLHQDKQNIESQIADLFAFYSKQANNGTAPVSDFLVHNILKWMLFRIFPSLRCSKHFRISRIVMEDFEHQNPVPSAVEDIDQWSDGMKIQPQIYIRKHL